MARYRLDDLGWYQFEQLIQSLLKMTYGLNVESWGGRSDQGRDAYCADDLEISPGTKSKGPFLFQVKFVAEANAAGADPNDNLKSAIRNEKYEIERRIKNGEWSTIGQYYLITNVPLNDELRSYIHSKIHEADPVCQVTSLGSDDVCDLLDNNPNIRISFPQILSLRDINYLLNQIVAKPIIERSTLSVEIAAELAQVFAPTETYYQVLNKLNKYNFVVLTGPPEVGKTTIARIIGLAKFSENWECYECNEPSDFFQAYEKDKPQIFLADDAFGSTEFKPTLARLWEKDLEFLLHRLNKTHWLIWTSRPVPLHMALQKMHIEGKAESFPEPAKLLVDATKLTIHEKVLILYRHCRALNLSDSLKSIIKNNARLIVNSEHFTPERVRRFVTDTLPRFVEDPSSDSISIHSIQQAVREEIEEPTRRMRQSFSELPINYKRFLFAMLDSKSDYVLKHILHQLYDDLNNVELDESFKSISETLGTHFIREYRSFMYSGHDKYNAYKWMHPSWRDLVIEELEGNTVERRNFLNHCGINGLKLALSTGGGSKGDKIFPLAITYTDWEAIQNNVRRLLKESLEGTADILTFLSDTATIDSRDKSNIGDLSELKSIIDDSLSMSRAIWDEANVVIKVKTLQQYFELSLFTKKYANSPVLDATWEFYSDGIISELNPFEVVSDIDTEPLLDWVNLVKLIRDNEPRFLRIIGYPRSISPRISEKIKSIHENLEDDFEPDYISGLQEELKYIEEFQLFLEHISWPFCKFEKEINEIDSILERWATDLKEALEKEEPPERDWDEYYESQHHYDDPFSILDDL